MPRRPVLQAPAFGQWLRALWQGHSYERIAQKLRPYVELDGLKVDRSSVKKLEDGRVPNWPMLFAISAAFNVSMEDTLRALSDSLSQSRDLSRHGRTQCYDDCQPATLNHVELFGNRRGGVYSKQRSRNAENDR